MIDTRAQRTHRHLELRRRVRAPEDLRSSLRTLQLPSPEQINHGRVRILIADDHEIVRRGLCSLLDLDPALDVVGDAANGTQAVRLAHRLRPDVVLMDLLMPELDGIAATEAIRRELPDTQVVVLTSLLEDASVCGAVRAGAIGYLLKDTSAPELRQAIKPAAAGQVQLSPHAAARLMRQAGGPESHPGRTLRRTGWPGSAGQARRSRHYRESGASRCIVRHQHHQFWGPRR